jgi:small conductance mechanosensitive channel
MLKEIHGLQRELLRLVIKLEDAGVDTSSIMAEFRAWFRLESQLYAKAIQRISSEVTALRAQRIVTEPEDMALLEVRIHAEKAVLDTILAGQMETLEGADSVGLNVTRQWEALDKFLLAWGETQVGRLQLAVAERSRVQDQLRAAQRAGRSDTELSNIRTLIQVTEQRVDGDVVGLLAIANLLDRRGVVTTHYRQIIIQATGVTGDILDPDVMLGLLKEVPGHVWNWIKDNGPTALTRLLIVAATVMLFRYGFALAWWLLRLLGLVKMRKLLFDLASRMIRPTGTIVGLVFGLSFVGVDPSTLVAGLGVAGIIVGLALQDSMSNLAAGAFIVAYRPYDVDDIVTAAGVVGKVKQMGLANTTIVTFDNRRLFVPNRKIWSEVIENRTAEHVRRVEADIKVDYRQNLEKALALIKSTVESDDRVLSSPEPTLFVKDFGDSWLKVRVWAWVRTEACWDMTMALPRIIRDAFAEAGIEIPTPRREVAMKDATGDDISSSLE